MLVLEFCINSPAKNDDTRMWETPTLWFGIYKFVNMTSDDTNNFSEIKNAWLKFSGRNSKQLGFSTIRQKAIFEY